MKKSFALSFFALTLTVGIVGCGPGEAKSITEDAQQSAIEAYRAAEAADQAAMNSEALPDL